jgi:hypothetical protein
MLLGVIPLYATAMAPQVYQDYLHATVEYGTVFSVILPKQTHVSYVKRNYCSKRINVCPGARQITLKSTRHAYSLFLNAKYTHSLPIDTNKPFPRKLSPQIRFICNTPEIEHMPPTSPMVLDYTSHKNSCSRQIRHKYMVKLIIYNKFAHSAKRGTVSPRTTSPASHVHLDAYYASIPPYV